MENKIQNFLFWNHFIGNLVKKVWSSELFLRLPKVSSLALKWTMTLSIEASHLRGKYRPVSCQCYCVWCRCEACWLAGMLGMLVVASFSLLSLTTCAPLATCSLLTSCRKTLPAQLHRPPLRRSLDVSVKIWRWSSIDLIVVDDGIVVTIVPQLSVVNSVRLLPSVTMVEP